jgi:hypothetical protein
MRTFVWALMALFLVIVAPASAQVPPPSLGSVAASEYLEQHGVRINGDYRNHIDCGRKMPVPVANMKPYNICWVSAHMNGPELWFVWRGDNNPRNKWLEDRVVYYMRTGGPYYKFAKPRSLNPNGTTCSAPFSMPITAYGIVASRVDCVYRDSDTFLTSKDDFLMATFAVRNGYYATVVARPVGLFVVKWQLEQTLANFLNSLSIVEERKLSMK